MANSIPDIPLPGYSNGWTNLYTATGFAVGKALIILNKSPNEALLYISATSPAASSTSGYTIQQHETVKIDAGESGVWVKGLGPMFVQLG